MGRVFQNERAGKAHNRAEGIAVEKAVANRAVAAHGKAADERILPRVRERERPARKFHQIFADEFSKIVARTGVIHIEFVLCRGHYNGKIPILRPRGNAGAVYPIVTAAENAVQQIQRLQRPLRRVLRLPGHDLVRGQDHRYINGAH